MNENLNELREPRGAIVPLLIYGAVAVTGLLLSQFAFTAAARREIFKRDGYCCVICGATDHLEAAHIDHNRDNPNYNSPDNGLVMDAYCHMVDHIERAGHNGLIERHNEYAIQRCAERAYVSPEELEEIRLDWAMHTGQSST